MPLPSPVTVLRIRLVDMMPHFHNVLSYYLRGMLEVAVTGADNLW
jgi:hypothetical protein